MSPTPTISPSRSRAVMPAVCRKRPDETTPSEKGILSSSGLPRRRSLRVPMGVVSRRSWVHSATESRPAKAHRSPARPAAVRTVATRIDRARRLPAHRDIPHRRRHDRCRPRSAAMPRGDKDAYTDKQKRKAQHIEKGYEERGVPEDEAERRAWATVNKESGGGNKSGSGRGKKDTKASSGANE